MDEGNKERADAMRQEVGNAGMALMDMVDGDFATMLETFAEHVILMHRELMNRGMANGQATQVLTGFTVGILVPE